MNNKLLEDWARRQKQLDESCPTRLRSKPQKTGDYVLDRSIGVVVVPAPTTFKPAPRRSNGRGINPLRRCVVVHESGFRCRLAIGHTELHKTWTKKVAAFEWGSP